MKPERRPGVWIGALLAGSMLIAGCSGGDSDSDSAASPAVQVDMPTKAMSEADTAAVDQIVDSVWTSEAKVSMPGFWVGVWDPEKGVYLKPNGEAGEDQPATNADSFRIGSITKGFTSVVVLQLVADGKLALTDKVSDVDTDLAGQFPEAADLTIQQLLSMHSGIPDYLNTPEGLIPPIVADPQKVWTAEELIAGGFAAGKLEAPGSGGYSTTNYILLQKIAEKVGGELLRKQISDRVTGPLGLSSTLLPPNDKTDLPDPKASSLATPTCVGEFENSGGSVEVGTDLTEWNASYGQGGGGMTSKMADLGRWAASSTGNDLLPDDLAAQRLDFQDIGAAEYGLGIMKMGDWIGHEGEALGWEALALHNPQTGVTIAMASNSCGVALEFLGVVAELYPDSALS